MVEQKTLLLDELFTEWEPSVFRLPGHNGQPEDKGPFIRDGIIREDLWNENKRKVLFLLKEINKGKHEGLHPDYHNDFRKNCDEIPWRRLGEWAYGLQHAGTSIDFRNPKEEEWKQAFRSTAILNLKKTAGGSTINWSVLRQYALHESERARLQKELEIINPRIIVCCGRTIGDSMFEIARGIPLTSCGPGDLACSSSSNGISANLYYESETQRVWIDFVHPSIRGKHLKGLSSNGLQILLAKAFENFSATKQYDHMIS